MPPPARRHGPTVTPSGEPCAAPVGSRVDALMLVHQVERRAFAEGRTAIVLTLGTRAGRIVSAPLWGERQAWAEGLARGSVVRAEGRVGEYRAVRQLELSALTQVPGDSASLRALVPSTGTTGADWAVLEEVRCALSAPSLRATLAMCYDDPAFRTAYEACP